MVSVSHVGCQVDLAVPLFDAAMVNPLVNAMCQMTGLRLIRYTVT